MVKLIVTDMDGTFLDDQKKVADGTYEVLAKLKEMGVRFVVASGRQYDSLEKYFLDNLEDVVIISDNGSVIMENKQEVCSYPMDKGDVKLCLDAVKDDEDMGPVLCHRRKIYTDNDLGSGYFGRPQLHYVMDVVDDLYAHIDDVVKLNIIMGRGKNVYEANEKLKAVLPDSLHLAPSGHDIIDIGGKGVTKGMAVAKLQELWGIRPEETATFGDQFNDVELLDCGYYSYAIEGAVEGVCQHANFAGGNNNDGFVLKEICRLLDIKR